MNSKLFLYSLLQEEFLQESHIDLSDVYNRFDLNPEKNQFDKCLEEASNYVFRKNEEADLGLLKAIFPSFNQENRSDWIHLPKRGGG